jgi:hypothetical protein
MATARLRLGCLALVALCCGSYGRSLSPARRRGLGVQAPRVLWAWNTTGPGQRGPRGGGMLGAPILDRSGKRLFVGDNQSMVYAFDTASGQVSPSFRNVPCTTRRPSTGGLL